jgi:hypothetical protein
MEERRETRTAFSNISNIIGPDADNELRKREERNKKQREYRARKRAEESIEQREERNRKQREYRAKKKSLVGVTTSGHGIPSQFYVYYVSILCLLCIKRSNCLDF